MNLDYKFLCGDTNFRISYGNAETRIAIDEYINYMNSGKVEEAKGILDMLLTYDQLNQSKESEVLQKYQEGKITFLPTYKYDANSNVYDTSKKQRTPSW
jgi:Phosphatidylinositol 5-phosphate phosphatase